MYIIIPSKVMTTMEVDDGGGDGGRGEQWRWRAVALAAVAMAKTPKNQS